MTIDEGSPSITHFLNVDLDIYSSSDLQPLVSSLGTKVIVLHAGRERRSYSAHLELARAANSADPTIRRFCALIQALPRKERRLWDTARVRDFSIGVQAGNAPYSCDFVVKPETAAAVAELGARIVFTVYAPHDNAGPDRR